MPRPPAARVRLVLGLVALTAGAPARAGDPVPSTGSDGDRRAACLARNAAAPERYRGIVRAFCSEHHNHGNIGASLAIVERGAPRFTATAGEQCRGGPPVAPDTRFRVGSLTKLLTAALASTFVDDGRLALDAPLAPLLPELAAALDTRAGAITLRQLLQHTSGLADPDPRDLDPDDWLIDLGERPLWTTPGDLWSYSNAGYALAGAALERLAGDSYPALVSARLLAPLGRTRATVDLDMALQPDTACGHLGRGDTALALDVRDDLELGAGGARWTIPAGGLVASPTDLVELALGLVDPLRSPLSAAAIAGLLTASVPTHERPDERYSLGLRSLPLTDGGSLFLHSGNTGDFSADLYLIPDRGFAFALVANTGSPLRATAAAALHDLLGVDPPHPAPAGDLSRHFGVFTVNGWSAPIRVIPGDHDLALSSPDLGLPTAPLVHAGDDRFRLPARPDLGLLTFIAAGGGSGTTHLRARSFVAHRRDPG